MNDWWEPESLERDWLTARDPRLLVKILDRSGLLVNRGALRKQRLFAAACCREAWGALSDGRIGIAVQTAERYVEDLAADAVAALDASLQNARVAQVGHPRGRPDYHGAALAKVACEWRGTATPSVLSAVCSDAGALGVPAALQADFLRDLFGPFTRLRRHASTAGWLSGGSGSSLLPRILGVLSWADGQWARELATSMNATRKFDQMPQLGGFLESAGISSHEVREHCRGWHRCAACLGRCVEGDGQAPCTHCSGAGWVRLPTVHVPGCWVIDLLLGY